MYITIESDERAEALTVAFLKLHKERVSIEAFARFTVANVEARGADAALDRYGPNAQAEVGYYPVYAVHPARYALDFLFDPDARSDRYG